MPWGVCCEVVFGAVPFYVVRLVSLFCNLHKVSLGGVDVSKVAAVFVGQCWLCFNKVFDDVFGCLVVRDCESACAGG